MALDIRQIAARVESLKFRAAERDARAGDVLAVRQGKIADVYPEIVWQSSAPLSCPYPRLPEYLTSLAAASCPAFVG